MSSRSMEALGMFQNAVELLANKSLATQVAGVDLLRQAIEHSREHNTARMIADYLRDWRKIEQPTDDGLIQAIETLRDDLQSLLGANAD